MPRVFSQVSSVYKAQQCQSILNHHGVIVNFQELSTWATDEVRYLKALMMKFKG
jgi:hypothetical protein